MRKLFFIDLFGVSHSTDPSPFPCGPVLFYKHYNKKMYCNFLIFVSVLNLINSEILNTSKFLTRIKRTDIDLQTCIDNFNVHKDKIIRTQDSQNMGAKYLNEIDLGSREECLRLCCETDNCDVFVFEEKNSGGCYLFHCGPPEDFKCKFTHHVNYSSAVLAINRHLPDLESQIKFTKHEQDLNKLRKPEIEEEVVQQQQIVQTTNPTTTTTTTTPQPKTIEVLPEIMIKSNKEQDESLIKNEVRKCSRYQFECRSTGECIAIYNACDGIPQCTDGSDEAPELNCPDTSSLSLTTVLSVVKPNRNTIVKAATYDVSSIPVAPRLPQFPTSNLGQEEPIYRPQMQSHQETDFIRPVDGKNKLQYEQQYQMVQPQQVQIQNWLPHQSNQMPPQMPYPAVDKNSHIFNHKDSGFQVPEGQEMRYNFKMHHLHRPYGYYKQGQTQYSDGLNYQKMPNYYDYRPMQENWPANPIPDNINRYEVPQQPKVWAPEPPKPTPPPTPKLDPNPVNPKHIQDKMAHDLKHSKVKMDHLEKKVKIESHTYHYDVAAYKMTETKDGPAETPGGAMLSLTLGLIITCIMALMIGCRLKLRKRVRGKGGKAYAHDADYLVNGMYL